MKKIVCIALLSILFASCFTKPNKKRFLLDSKTTVLNKEFEEIVSDKWKPLMESIEFSKDQKESTKKTLETMIYMNSLPIWYFDNEMRDLKEKKVKDITPYLSFMMEYAVRQLSMGSQKGYENYQSIKELFWKHYRNIDDDAQIVLRHSDRISYRIISSDVAILLASNIFSPLGADLILAKDAVPYGLLPLVSNQIACDICSGNNDLIRLQDDDQDEYIGRYGTELTPCEVITALSEDDMFESADPQRKQEIIERFCDLSSRIKDNGFRINTCIGDAIRNASRENNQALEDAARFEAFNRCLVESGYTVNQFQRSRSLKRDWGKYMTGGCTKSNKCRADEDELEPGEAYGEVHYENSVDEESGKNGKTKVSTFYRYDGDESKLKRQEKSFVSNDGKVKTSQSRLFKRNGKSVQVRKRTNQETGTFKETFTAIDKQGNETSKVTITKISDDKYVLERGDGSTQVFDSLEKAEREARSTVNAPQLGDLMPLDFTNNPETLPIGCMHIVNEIYNRDPGKRDLGDLINPDPQTVDPLRPALLEAIDDCLADENYRQECDALIRCPDATGCDCGDYFSMNGYSSINIFNCPNRNTITCIEGQRWDPINCRCADYAEENDFPNLGPDIGPRVIELEGRLEAINDFKGRVSLEQ